MTRSLPVPPRTFRARAPLAGIILLVSAVAMGCGDNGGEAAVTTEAEVAPAAVLAENLATVRPGNAAVQQAMNRAVAENGVPGMVAEVLEGHRSWFGRAGVADTATGREQGPRERIRIGSAAKAFTATVVLQLEAAGEVDLDDKVEKWLPGLVRGNGNDGREITIRHLLNHTSGIFNYGNDAEIAKTGQAFFEHRFDSYTPGQLVEVGLRNPRYFAEPGDGFVYSNTGYILAGLIIEKVSGNTLADEIRQRIVLPLHLEGTYLPGEEVEIRGPHPRHYSTLFVNEPAAQVYDVTEQNVSYGWAAGGMVSTVEDVTQFTRALLQGRILPPAQQREMFTMVRTVVKDPATGTEIEPWISGTTYGLGAWSWTLGCGREVWGIGGAISGAMTFSFGTRDGKLLVGLGMNTDQMTPDLTTVRSVLEAKLCPAGP
ncbi:serine hydrolase domain-containing protein [Amycolatopsis magusensis]|uniref:serine hydrolase domain-containing protein n=1 Tax=Amycolatopsis magusensis TaxID=882444 RepID=UPI0024A87A06|nr:serine hydrolase domain-containing protein [Amycolatopsis magusensis]MDI5976730.1 serine hydrolase domain-containing protein [Amycolatopsis magusensis]